MNYTWFKLHHELPDDIKMRKFTPQEKWAWVVLLCLASKSSSRGTIHAHDDDIAEYCEFNTTQDWLYYRDKLIAKGMLEFTHDGGLRVEHWENRQYDKPSDRPEAVKARVAKHRAKKKEQNNDAVTPCNAIQTPCNEQTRLEEIRSDQKTEDQITHTNPDAQPDQSARVRDSFNEPEQSEQSECVEKVNPSEPSKPNKQSSSVDPISQTETPKAVQKVAEDRYSAARRFSPEEIKNNAVLRADLAMRTGFKYPELIAAGLEEIWIGPGYSDFAPGVIAEACRYLRGIDKPCEQGNGITYLVNRVNDCNWTALETCLKNSKARSSRQSASSDSPLPISTPPQPLTDEEIARRKAGIEIARRAMHGAA